MPDSIIFFFQLLSYLVFFIPFKILFAIQGKIPKNIKDLKKGSLLVSNHQTHIDPWIIMHKIPFLVGLKLLPIRFPVTHEYMKRANFSKLLNLLGCYDIGSTSKEKMAGLFYTRQLLKNGETVFLFPEGKISKDGSVADFKKGIEFFIKDSRAVVFAKMSGFNKINFPSLRAPCSINFTPVQDFREKEFYTKDIESIYAENFFKEGN